MMKATTYSASELIRMYEGLESDRSTMDNHVQEIVDLVQPSMADVVNINSTGGRKKGERRYDSTAGLSAGKLVKAIHSALTSSAMQWFNVVLKNDDLMDQKAIGDWFAKCSRIMFDYMVESNFHNEIQRTYQSLVCPGTSAMVCDPIIDPRTMKFQKLKYDTWSFRDFVFAEGADDLPTMVMRMHKLTPAKAMEKFGNHARFKGFSDPINKAYENHQKKYKEKFEFVEVFYKRTMYDEDKSRKRNVMHYPWGYCVVERKAKRKIIEGGQMEQSVAVGRWDKNADDNGWGRSPSMDALPSIKTLNDIMENGLKSLKKDLNPPLIIQHRGVIGNVRTHDGGIMYKRKGAEIDTLDSGTRYDAAQLYQEGFKTDIQKHYFVDQIEMTQNDSKTLGEYYSRYQTMMRMLGPTYGRLTYEIFNPMLFRTFNVLLRNDVFPEMPEELIEIAGNPETQEYIQLDVKYTGALARSQRQEEVDSILMSYNDAASISEVTGDISAFDWLDSDRAMQLSTQLRGVPSEVVRSADDVQAHREKREQMMAEAQERQSRAEEAATVDAEAEAGGKVIDMQSRMAQ